MIPLLPPLKSRWTVPLSITIEECTVKITRYYCLCFKPSSSYICNISPACYITLLRQFFLPIFPAIFLIISRIKYLASSICVIYLSPRTYHLLLLYPYMVYCAVAHVEVLCGCQILQCSTMLHIARVKCYTHIMIVSPLCTH